MERKTIKDIFEKLLRSELINSGLNIEKNGRLNIITESGDVLFSIKLGYVEETDSMPDRHDRGSVNVTECRLYSDVWWRAYRLTYLDYVADELLYEYREEIIETLKNKV